MVHGVGMINKRNLDKREYVPRQLELTKMCFPRWSKDEISEKYSEVYPKTTTMCIYYKYVQKRATWITGFTWLPTNTSYEHWHIPRRFKKKHRHLEMRNIHCRKTTKNVSGLGKWQVIKLKSLENSIWVWPRAVVTTNPNEMTALDGNLSKLPSNCLFLSKTDSEHGEDTHRTFRHKTSGSHFYRSAASRVPVWFSLFNEIDVFFPFFNFPEVDVFLSGRC